MAKLSAEEKERIIKRDLPGYKIVENSPVDSADEAFDYVQPEAEADTPDIRALRRKYFGIADELANGPTSGAADSVGLTDDEIVTVEPENKSDVLDRGGRAKSVVISNGEVTGSQG